MGITVEGLSPFWGAMVYIISPESALNVCVPSRFIRWSTIPKQKWKCQMLSRVRFFATPWTVAHQAPLPMGFSRQEYWSGLPLPSPEDLLDPGMEPTSPVLQEVGLLGGNQVWLRSWGWGPHNGISAHTRGWVTQSSLFPPGEVQQEVSCLQLQRVIPPEPNQLARPSWLQILQWWGGSFYSWPATSFMVFILDTPQIYRLKPLEMGVSRR